MKWPESYFQNSSIAPSLFSKAKNTTSNMRPILRIVPILLLCTAWTGLLYANQEETEEKSRSSVYGAFSRGEALTWDQLQIVAKDAGISGSQLLEMKIRDRMLRLIQRYQLPLEISGFSDGMPADEEFRVTKASDTSHGLLEMNQAFWNQHP